VTLSDPDQGAQVVVYSESGSSGGWAAAIVGDTRSRWRPSAPMENWGWRRC